MTRRGTTGAGTGRRPASRTRSTPLFGELADDLLYHGDPDAALRRLLTSGFERPDGEQVQGLRELMERLRQRRQEELDSGELGGAFQEIAQELDDVVAEEREGLQSLADDARQSGDERRQEVTDDVVAERTIELEMLPPTWPAGSGACRTTTSSPPRRGSTSKSCSRSCARRSPRASSTRCPRP